MVPIKRLASMLPGQVHRLWNVGELVLQKLREDDDVARCQGNRLVIDENGLIDSSRCLQNGAKGDGFLLEVLELCSENFRHLIGVDRQDRQKRLRELGPRLTRAFGEWWNTGEALADLVGIVGEVGHVEL